MRPNLALLLLLLPLGARPIYAQDATLPGKIFEVEDRRAPSENDLSVLFRGLASRDTTVIARAARALGRLERPALATRLIPLLEHRAALVRREAAQAVAQAAQGFRGDSSLEHRGAAWPEIVAALQRRVTVETVPGVVGMLALSLGRLPYVTGAEITSARSKILAASALVEGNDPARLEATRGMATLIRTTFRRLGDDLGILSRLESAARNQSTPGAVRRHALGALARTIPVDSATISALLSAPEPESRRVAVSVIAQVSAPEARGALLARAQGDSSAAVRLEAVRVGAALLSTADCPALVRAAGDHAIAVALMALDQLRLCSGDTLAVNTLRDAMALGGSWHRAAHALVSLARVGPQLAHTLLPPAVNAPVWQTRMYAARAATQLLDSLALLRLARDSVANVREAAITGLVTVTGHGADQLYRSALAAADYQLVLTAAQALAGSPQRREAALSILARLARLTAERRETSRDPRVALLVRLRELGSPRDTASLTPYLGDFDPAVADSAAAILASWTGRPQRASPRRLPIVAVTLAEAEALQGKTLRFTMASGGTFEVDLNVKDAPATVARIARLVRKGYYDGLTWHRLVPNFVIQGGSPGANEYAGDGPFMRDELGPRSHERGTLGVSTRGRDTGDGQLFINLVDSPRLDYEYTVWGRVVSGMAVVDAILEGDVIRRVEIRPR